MSTHPRLEARVSALERRQTHLDARIEEVTEDITTSFKNLSEDMTASFKQVDEYLVKIDETTEKRLNEIEATLEQHTALLTEILARLPKPQP